MQASYELDTLKRVLVGLDLCDADDRVVDPSRTAELRLMIRTAIRVRRPLRTTRQSSDDLVLSSAQAGLIEVALARMLSEGA